MMVLSMFDAIWAQSFWLARQTDAAVLIFGQRRLEKLLVKTCDEAIGQDLAARFSRRQAVAYRQVPAKVWVVESGLEFASLWSQA